MVKSKLVIEMSLSDMLELRALYGIVHQLRVGLPDLVKELDDRTRVGFVPLLDELTYLTPKAMNILSSITSYDEEEAESYREEVL